MALVRCKFSYISKGEIKIRIFQVYSHNMYIIFENNCGLKRKFLIKKTSYNCHFSSVTIFSEMEIYRASKQKLYFKNTFDLS